LAQQIIGQSHANQADVGCLAVEIHAGRTAELIRSARLAWAVSGSVGLELMFETLPSVVIYKVKRLDLWLARPFIRAKYISLVNLLADAEVFPEYLTCRDVSGELVRWAEAWLDDSPARRLATASLATLRHHVARPGASAVAARSIINWLKHNRLASRPVEKGLPRPPHRHPHELRAGAERAT
jgi:lipid-A-disaccharide synthase